ncbi:hypothetical protein HPB52_012536 [Rhipicephalus sanguineus]|uniref:Multiple epidermal growth factor-like domains protein 8 n=1 Tax=Rhipicephalus sanguineus TaxID=34632 RepID=A0A9D4T9W7_RHISA|nr:hypothetical protein HPB52_012536 [Rhipicephalus sanguineus]
MLILLYSDTNYVLKGFVAEYSITQCPSNCSGHGSCGRDSCVCDLAWAGPDCGTPVCPSSCHAEQGQGNCSFPCATTSSPGLAETPHCCRCSHGFAGISCSLPENPNDSAAGWHLLSRGSVPFVARAGHAGVYLPFTDQLFVFGGRAFGHVLGDFLVYNFNESTWHDLTVVKPRPAARWGHAMAPYAHTIALHGGELANGSLSSELWLYNVAKREWTLELPSPAGHYPPAVALHTLTPGDGNHLYVFGGRTSGGVFSDALYRVNPRNGTQWERVSYVGSVPPSVGHAAVFHTESRSLLVHGGVVVDYARFSKLSSALWAFHVDANRWTRLERTPLGGEAPTERAFHAAALVGGYMVLFGGYMHKHSFVEKCFDDGIYLYHLRCHKWVSFKLVAGDLLAIDLRRPARPTLLVLGVAALVSVWTEEKSRNPVNLSQPDQVSYVSNSSQHLIFTSEYQDEQEGGGEHVARLLGFLHPRGAQPSSGEPLRLFLDISGGRAALRLGQAGSTRLEDTELVAQLSAHSYNRTEAKRPSGQPLLPSSTAAQELRYLLDLSLHAPAKYCTKQCTCSERVRKQFPSLGGPREASWSYAQCPNVNECKLKLARCHPDATCYDTAHSYRCQCNRGFKGDGTIACVKTKGSFGNATSPFGCRKCACNEHGDSTRGMCDSSTGNCYCLHNTHGKHCESCQPGYFGDPRNGGRCFIDCSPKRVVYVEPDGGGLGVPEMEGPVEAHHCLWILTSTLVNRSNTLSM